MYFKGNIMKAAIALIVLLFVLTCCINENDEIRSETGTVKYISLEGGFYGITGTDNKNYDPVNLSSEYKVDGLKITFKYKISDELASYHMWGTSIELIYISKKQLNREKK
jgi:hypothetical protein